MTVLAEVILPVLNEAEALPWVLPRLPEGYRAIVVDNGSTDASPEIAADLGAVVVRESQRGFGSACFTGLTAATADVVAFMDCDGSLDPASLPLVVDPIVRNTTDLMLAARRAERGAWPLHARLGNRYVAREVGRLTGVRLSDLGPMRAARREALLALGLADRRSGWPLEMVLSAGAAGWRIGEVDVAYLRRTGRSKVTGTVRGTLHAVVDMRSHLRTFPSSGALPTR